MPNKKLATKIQLGAHVSIARGLDHALEEVWSIGGTVGQIFIQPPQRYGGREFGEQELVNYKKKQVERPTPMIVHAPYILNPASGEEEKRQRSVSILRENIAKTALIGSSDLVLHIGNAVGITKAAGVKNLIKSIKALIPVLSKDKVYLDLEVAAGQGSAVGSTLEEIAVVIGSIKNSEYLGLCLDTAHLYAAGYDLRTEADVAQLVGNLKKLKLLSRLRVWHLNDSKVPLGAGKDRHEWIGEGEIGKEAFRLILARPEWRQVPMIIETPARSLADHAENLRRLRRLLP